MPFAMTTINAVSRIGGYASGACIRSVAAASRGGSSLRVCSQGREGASRGCVSLLGVGGDGALVEEGAAVFAGAGAQVDQPVGVVDYVEVVFDHYDGVVVGDEGVQYVEQGGDVGGVEAGGGFVEEVEGGAGGLVEFLGDFQALGFAAGEGGEGLAEVEVAEADGGEGAEGGGDGGVGEAVGGLVDGEGVDVGDGAAVDGVGEDLGEEAAALAGLADGFLAVHEGEVGAYDAEAVAFGAGAFGVGAEQGGGHVVVAGEESADGGGDAGVGDGGGAAVGADRALVDDGDGVLGGQFGADRHGTTSRRHVEPHRQIHLRLRWYLLGWDLDRDDWRVFRLDRVTGLVRTGRRHLGRDLPAHTAVEYVTRGMNADRRRVRLVVRAAAHEVADALNRHDADIRRVGERETHVTVRLDSWNRLIGALVFLDADFSVVEPDEFRAACAAFARRLLAAARPDDGDAGDVRPGPP